jgi:hypothetical protein
MTRFRKDSDREFSADPPASEADTDCPARMIAQSEPAELFDQQARLRFGQLISEIASTLTKRRR